jgi:hypothetical protein
MILDVFNALDKAYKTKNISELLERIKGLGAEDVKHRSLKEAGIKLGGMSNFWRIAYISGKKAENAEASGRT